MRGLALVAWALLARGAEGLLARAPEPLPIYEAPAGAPGAPGSPEYAWVAAGAPGAAPAAAPAAPAEWNEVFETTPPGGQFFDYSKHGENWGGSCQQPKRQSPINFEQPLDEPAAQAFMFDYDPIKVPMTPYADGVFKFGVDDPGGIVYEETYYPLISAQLHTESEHTYFGKHTILELQLFHKRQESDHIVAVAFRLQPPPVLRVNRTILSEDVSRRVLNELRALGEKAPGFSRPMMHFLEPAKTNGWNALNFNDLFRGMKFWEYQGSLTRPPCSEVVTWIVRRDPVSLSPRQAQLVYSNLRITMQGQQNDRNTFPLGDRKVRTFAAVPAGPRDNIRKMHAPTVEDFVPVGPNPREDRTDRMNGYAQAAFEAANEADQASQELDYREQKAAFDYAKQMAPYLMKYVPPPVKPRFANFEYGGWDPEIDTMKVAESMSKAVGSLAANSLKRASDDILEHTKKAAYKAAQEAFKEAERNLREKSSRVGVKVNMFR